MNATPVIPRIPTTIFPATHMPKTADGMIFLVLLLMGFLATPTSLSAQTENVWLGNTFGKVGDWHAPENWSRGHIPTDMELAVIPDLSAKGKICYPVIRFEAEVGRLRLAPMARVTILEGASLLIDQIEEDDVAGLKQIQNLGEIYVLPEDISPKLIQRLATLGMVKVGREHAH